MAEILVKPTEKYDRELFLKFIQADGEILDKPTRQGLDGMFNSHWLR